MGRRCPPGVLCIENMTMIMLIVITGVLIYLYNNYNKQIVNNYTMQVKSPDTNITSDVNYMPVNIKTQNRGQSSYTQIGILSRTTNEDTIMPLFGMNINTGRDKWKYYTLTEHNVRLPVSVGGKSCTNDYGCDAVSNGDYIYVEGYNDAFKVTLYDDVNRLTYIPYI